MENCKKSILKHLESITARGYSASTVFNDWLRLMLYAFLGNDDEYLKIVARYRNDRPRGEREIDHFCFALAELMKAMAETNDEILGELYMQWGISNKCAGQFFTPKHIAECMAKIVGNDGERVSDPSCGSGIMLVSQIKQMTNEQLDTATFCGQDLDLTCVMMCALNMLFFNVNAYVIWGNTLLMEKLRVFRTKRSYLGGEIYEIDIKSIPVQEAEIIKQSIQQALPLAA